MDIRAALLHQEFAPFLTPESGAGWIRLPPGGVLLHEGHSAPGTFLAISGMLRTVSPRGLAADVPAPCVVPPLGEWDAPSALTWSVKTESELLFVPRSRLLEPSAYRNAFESVVIATLALPVHSAEETR